MAHTTSQKISSGSNTQVKLLAKTALFAAFITIMTAYLFHIPVGINGSYIHFGDSLIYLAACLLPTPYAMAAAAIGGGLADLLTAPIWAPATIIIKVLVALPFSSKKSHLLCVRNVLATLLAFLITGVGYFLAESILLGTKTALLLSFSSNFVQSLGSAIIFFVLAAFLDKINFKFNFPS